MFTPNEMTAAGVCQFGFVAPAEIPFDSGIQKICEGNSCRQYGKTWACPPAVGSMEECRDRCLRFSNAMVFNAVYPLDDSFDYEGMIAAHRKFKKLCDSVYHLAKSKEVCFLLLSNEGCIRCEQCTYPHEKCRMPDLLFPSVEGFGINVMNLASLAGIKYSNGVNTVTYFGMLLYGNAESPHPK